MYREDAKLFSVARVNISAWVVLIMAYVLPYSTTDEKTSIGFPFGFIHSYDFPSQGTLFTTSALNIFALLLNIVLVYIFIYVISRIVNKVISHNKEIKRAIEN